MLAEVRTGLAVQVRVVQALILRETRTRFGKQQLGYLWAFLEPGLFIATFYLAFLVAGRKLPMGMDIVTFITTGLVPFQMFRSIINRSMTAVKANSSLLTYPAVRHLDLHIARFVLETVTFSVIIGVILGTHGILFPELFAVPDPLRVLAGLLGCALLGFGAGLLLASAAVLFPSVERVQSAILRPLFWISGVFFTANGLPPAARELLMWNPVLHAVEIIRDGFFSTYRSEHSDPTYLALWIVAMIAMGLVAETIARDRLNE